VLAFDASLISGKALSDLNKLAFHIDEIDKKKKSEFHIVVFGSGNEPPAGLARSGSVTYITRNAATIADQVKSEFPGAYLSIAVQRNSDDTMGDIAGDFRSRQPSSYVVLEQTEKTDIIGQVNIASLLYLISTKKPCGIFLGRFKGRAVDEIQSILASIGGLYRMLTDVGKAISEIFQSIKATARSA
jgi:phage-related minor tail protein